MVLAGEHHGLASALAPFEGDGGGPSGDTIPPTSMAAHCEPGGSASSPAAGSAPPTLADRVASYEAVINAASADGEALESLVTERWAHPRDALEWYYRAVALSRLGRRDDALDAYARAAELGPSWASGSPSEQTSATPHVPGCGPSEEAPLPTPADPSAADPVVTLVGTAGGDLALSGMFLAVNLDETRSSLSPQPSLPVVSPAEGSLEIAEATDAGSAEDPVPASSRADEDSIGPAPASSTPEADASDAEPLDASGWYYRGITLARMQRFEEAVEAYERAVEADDCNAAAWHYLGITLARVGRHAEALQAYVRALELDCRNPAIWINQAMSLTQLGRHAQAQAAHDQAVKLEGAQEHRAPRVVPRRGGPVRAAHIRARRSGRRRWGSNSDT